MRGTALKAATCTGLAVGAVLWASIAPASAALRLAAFDASPWVGSSGSSRISGQVRSDLQLGINFGVDIIGDGDITTLSDLLLSVDLTKADGVAVVTGLTAGCNAAPTLITCKVSPGDKATQFQSMTLLAAPGAAADATGTITVSISWPDDGDSGNDIAVIDLSIAPSDPGQGVGPGDPTPVETAPAKPTPPVVIAPLPDVGGPGQSLHAPVAGSGGVPLTGVTLRPTLPQVPNVLSTRQPGIVEIGADGTKHVENAGAAPGDATPWSSPVFTVALGASSMGLLALLIFGVVNARRALRPTRPAGALRASDPTRLEDHIRRH